MPPMPPMPAAAARRWSCGVGRPSFGLSATSASVVSMRPATEAAFLQRRANDFRRIDDTSCDQVFVLKLGSVVAEVACAFLDFRDHDRPVNTSVAGDLAKWLFQGTANDVDAKTAIVLEGDFVERADAANQRNAAARNDALFDCRAGRVHGVFDAGLLLFHLNFGCRHRLG